MVSEHAFHVVRAYVFLRDCRTPVESQHSPLRDMCARGCQVAWAWEVQYDVGGELGRVGLRCLLCSSVAFSRRLLT